MARFEIRTLAGDVVELDAPSRDAAIRHIKSTTGSTPAVSWTVNRRRDGKLTRTNRMSHVGGSGSGQLTLWEVTR